MRALDPEVLAIVMSGYAEGGLMATHSEHGFRAALAKPFDLARLQAILKSSD